MSPKIKPSKPRRDPVSSLPAVILLFILSLVSYVSQIVLHPVYGSVGTHLHHYNVVLTISTATSLLTFFGFDRRRLQSQTWKAIAMILICAPLILPTLFRFSGQWGPIWGPILTQAVMTWPCLFLTTHDISRRVLNEIRRVEIHSISLHAFLALLTAVPLTVFLNISEKFLGQYFQPFIGVFWSRFSIFVYLGIFALFVDNLLINRNKLATLVLVVAAVVPIALLVLSRPHVITGVNSGLLARLPSEYIYLDRRESITGIITVVENSQHGYRVLKCDHSLLGGLWTGMKWKELSDRGMVGQDLEKRSVDEAESVYSAFLVQEAARLIQRPQKQDAALIIGLGVGITAKSFHKFGINVTAVEIDPIVHQFAEKYFGLPKINVVYNDGRKFVEESSKNWDFIVHDVFTGGSVPAHLFTKEMWSATKAVLADNGVVAVNMVGPLEDTSTKAVISTLLSSFDYCRGFRDPLDSSEGPANMALFCASFAIKFRDPTPDDFQGSSLREKALSSFITTEINLSQDDLILTDGNNHLNSWQVDGALEHWRVIRTVLADQIWINY